MVTKSYLCFLPPSRVALCERAEAAAAFSVLVDFGLASTFAACEATLALVFLCDIIITAFLFKVQGSSDPHPSADAQTEQLTEGDEIT